MRACAWRPALAAGVSLRKPKPKVPTTAPTCSHTVCNLRNSKTSTPTSASIQVQAVNDGTWQRATCPLDVFRQATGGGKGKCALPQAAQKPCAEDRNLQADVRQVRLESWCLICPGPPWISVKPAVVTASQGWRSSRHGHSKQVCGLLPNKQLGLTTLSSAN